MTNAGWQMTNAGWRMGDDKRRDETGHPRFPGAGKWVATSATLLRHENSRYGETKDVALTFNRRLQRFVLDPFIEAYGSDADDGRQDKGM